MKATLISVLITVCLTVQITKGTFVCPTLFDFYPDPEDCTKFYRCFWGAAYPFHCPTGTKWNHKLLTCDFSHNVNCGSNEDLAETIVIKDMEYDVKDDGQYDYDDQSTNYDYSTDDKANDYTTDDTVTYYESDNSEQYDYTSDKESAYDYDTDGEYNEKNTGEAVGLEEKQKEVNSPTHGGRLVVDKPDELNTSPSTGKSIIDYLYPDYIDTQATTNSPDSGKDRSDVTHDYSWYEGKDYDTDYELDRHLDNHYEDYIYDYVIDKGTNDYGIPSDGQATPDDEISYFQNGYPGYRHHYQPEDFLSPAYARHNGPIGRRK